MEHEMYTTSYKRSHGKYEAPLDFSPPSVKHKNPKIITNHPEFSMYETTNTKLFKVPESNHYNYEYFRKKEEPKEKFTMKRTFEKNPTPASTVQSNFNNEYFTPEFMQKREKSVSRVMECAERIKNLKKQKIPTSFVSTYNERHHKKGYEPSDIRETQFHDSQIRGRGKRNPPKNPPKEKENLYKKTNYVKKNFVTNVISSTHLHHGEKSIKNDTNPIVETEEEKKRKDDRASKTTYGSSYQNREKIPDYTNDCFKRVVTLKKDRYGNTAHPTKGVKQNANTDSFDKYYRLKTGVL